MALVLCQRNSYLQQITTKVLKCIAVKPTQKSSPPMWDVMLEDTILFPTGGGQPCDFGEIGDAKVVDVQRTKDGVFHRVTEAVTEGQELPVKVDWRRRYDHMQQHSGEILFSCI